MTRNIYFRPEIISHHFIKFETYICGTVCGGGYSENGNNGNNDFSNDRNGDCNGNNGKSPVTMDPKHERDQENGPGNGNGYGQGNGNGNGNGNGQGHTNNQ